MNVLTKYFLLLGILLLGGVLRLPAAACPLAKSISEDSCAAATTKTVEVFTDIVSGKEQQKLSVHEFIFETEEETELVSTKKRVASNTWFAERCFVPTFDDSLRSRKLTALYQHFPSSASSWHVIIQVFRI